MLAGRMHRRRLSPAQPGLGRVHVHTTNTLRQKFASVTFTLTALFDMNWGVFYHALDPVDVAL
jgi:hypothetical protein